MSFFESKATATASSWPRPRISTTVSSWPATTCAFVTTVPSPAAQPEPETRRPHALPSTWTTESPARRTSGSAGTPVLGGPTSTSGPSTRGNGSKRASALSSVSDGRTSLSLSRIADRWTVRRTSLTPGVCSTITPMTQANPSASATASAAPSSPSRAPNADDRMLARSDPAMLSAPAEMIVPAMTAPSRPKSGAYGDSLPSESSCGPKRVPMYAPATKPASDSTPTRKPRAKPTSPKTTANPMMT